MKKTIKLFMVAVALFISGNLFAQTISDYQKRLHDIQLCQDYFQNSLSPNQMNVVTDEITYITQKLTDLNSAPSAATPLDNIITQHPTDADVQLYIKYLALLTEPGVLMGRNLTPQEISDYQSIIASHVGKISQRY
jgi:hypothetical protein